RQHEVPVRITLVVDETEPGRRIRSKDEADPVVTTCEPGPRATSHGHERHRRSEQCKAEYEQPELAHRIGIAEAKQTAEDPSRIRPGFVVHGREHEALVDLLVERAVPPEIGL